MIGTFYRIELLTRDYCNVELEFQIFMIFDMYIIKLN